MRNRFLGGASFLPLFAAEGKSGGGEQPELALDPAEIAAHGDPDFEANAAGDDPGDINGPVEGEGDELPADTKTEADGAKEEPKAEEKAEEEDPKAELEQLRKTTKALGKRVSVLSKEKRELSTKLQQSIKEVPAEPAADAETPQREDFKTKAEFEIAVKAEAARVRAFEAFNESCNKIEAAGSKAFGDKWGKAKADLSMLDDQGRIPMDILSVALETDDPARVLFVLGNDIERATELMGMTPIKRAIAMDKIASSKAAERPKSNTPPPVEPIGGRGAGDDRPTDRDSDEEWNRKEALRERRAAEEKRKLRGY
jgi:hypothetical protein